MPFRIEARRSALDVAHASRQQECINLLSALFDLSPSRRSAE